MIVSIWFANLTALSLQLQDEPLQADLISVLPDISPTTNEDAVWGVFRTEGEKVMAWIAQRQQRPTVRGL